MFANRFIDSVATKTLRELEGAKEKLIEIEDKNEIQDSIIKSLSEFSEGLTDLINKSRQQDKNNGNGNESK